MLLGISCVDQHKPKKVVPEMPIQKEETFFGLLADFPIIADTASFIAELQKTFELESDINVSLKHGIITTFERVKLYGSTSDFYFIEYDWGYSGAMASYPWKHQLLLTQQGKLVKTLSAQRFQFVEVFKNQHPFLLAVVVTSKGNGGHQLFKISGDTLENVYEGYYDYATQTYDAHQDIAIYKPNELILSVKDVDLDGYNDLTFSGQLVYIRGQTKLGDWYDSETINGRELQYSMENPFKTKPIEFVFLYDKQTGHFKAKEKYVEPTKLRD